MEVRLETFGAELKVAREREGRGKVKNTKKNGEQMLVMKDKT